MTRTQDMENIAQGNGNFCCTQKIDWNWVKQGFYQAKKAHKVNKACEKDT